MSDATSPKIRLFREVLSCQSCLFSWEGHVHGFSRGHAVLRKGDKLLFIPDDLAYLFPDAPNFDYCSVFENEGWVDLESCPKCGELNLFPPQYDQNKMEDVDCIYVDQHDLAEECGVWSLTGLGRTKIQS